MLGLAPSISGGERRRNRAANPSPLWGGEGVGASRLVSGCRNGIDGAPTCSGRARLSDPHPCPSPQGEGVPCVSHVMLGLDPSISGRESLPAPIVLRFSGLRFAPPENDGQPKSPPAFACRRHKRGAAERREARSLKSASIEPGCGADGLSHHPHAPWRSAYRRFDDSGPRLSGRKPACAASPFDASSAHRLVASSRAWDEGVMPPTGPASSSHRDRIVPRAVPRSLPSLACKASRRRRAHPHHGCAVRMAAPRG